MEWWMWLIVGLVIWSVIGSDGKHRRRTCRKSRRRHREPGRYEEVSRLKRELEDSQAQISALKSRLEAVETIVTDEEAELRREFRRLQEG